MGSEDENEILLKAAKLASTAKEKIDILVQKREEKTSEIRHANELKLGKLKSNLTGRFGNVKNLFENRVLQKNGVYYIIVSVEIKGKHYILCKRMWIAMFTLI